MAVTLLDYFYGFSVASSDRKKAKFFLGLSVFNNLGILAIFKYYDFFVLQFQQGLELLGLHTSPVLLSLVLPIGISFYTFHGMSYVFDIYRRKQEPVKNIVDYAVFVSFFPLLVAGPIERANHLLPQIRRKRSFNYNQAIEGCRLILWGMVKKIVIADNLAGTVDKIFGNYATFDPVTLSIGAIAFSFQIYTDFSGYSDIAIGTAKLFGFELFSNFRFPYFARSITDFWRRWHISLTTWFKDYVYIPLGGSKHGRLKTIRNTFIIFVLSGFWHGASWNFIVWGLVHAFAFLPKLLFNRDKKAVMDTVGNSSPLPRIRQFGAMAATFTFVSFAWIFFRAPSLRDSLGYINGIFGKLTDIKLSHFAEAEGKSAFVYIIVLLLVDWRIRNNERNVDFGIRSRPLRWAVYALLIAIMGLFMKADTTSFIYFEF